MKKLLFKLPALAFVVFYSCNSSETEKKGADTTNNKQPEVKQAPVIDKAVGRANYFITEEEAKIMMDHFKAVYTDDNLESAWVDKEVIVSIGSTFENSNDFDGLRLIFGVDLGNKSKIILVPTTATEGCTPNQATVTCHKNVYGEVFSDPSNPPGSLSFTYFNRTAGEVTTMSDKFGKIYRKESKPGDHSTAEVNSLSVSVWIDRKIFIELKKKIEETANNIDGVNLLLAAYSNIVTDPPIPSQADKDQSTILIVPTRAAGQAHTNAWEIITGDPGFVKHGAYNHGELCLNACNGF